MSCIDIFHYDYCFNNCIIYMIMKEERQIGEVFKYNGVKLKVRKMSPWGECRKCFFFKEGNVTCGGPKCAAYERKDKNYVYFEKVEEGK